MYFIYRLLIIMSSSDRKLTYHFTVKLQVWVRSKKIRNTSFHLHILNSWKNDARVINRNIDLTFLNQIQPARVWYCIPCQCYHLLIGGLLGPSHTDASRPCNNSKSQLICSVSWIKSWISYCWTPCDKYWVSLRFYSTLSWGIVP